MNKKTLLVLPLCVIGIHSATQVTAQSVCQPIEVPSVCQGNHRININTISKNISPLNVCASPGEAITISITPANSTATIEGKNGGWPYGRGGTFTIVAPDEGTYEYNVHFEDGTCIDPRISVKG